MVSKSHDPNNLHAGHKKKPKVRKFPTPAECKALCGGSNATATVLHKIYHYANKPIITIDGHGYTAPTNDMLVEELGLSRSTIQKAIRELEHEGIIEIVRQHFRRSPRRYIRILKTPNDAHCMEIISSGVDSSDHGKIKDQPLSPPEYQAVHIESNKKKENKTNSQLIQGSSEPDTENSISPKGTDHSNGAYGSQTVGLEEQASNFQRQKLAAPKWQPQNFFEKMELTGAREKADRYANIIAYRIACRRGWDQQAMSTFQMRMTARIVREFCRAKLNKKDFKLFKVPISQILP